jgi:uncharacterized RDD family membrane protein YckC
MGGAITWRDALMRKLFDISFYMCSFFATIVTLSSVPPDSLSTMNYFNYIAIIMKYQPPFFSLLTFLIYVAYFTDIILFLFKRNHRSLHDIIAGTAVVRGETKISFKKSPEIRIR